jgi:hypothetical protein
MEQLYEERLSQIKILYDTNDDHPALEKMPKKFNIEFDITHRLMPMSDITSVKSKTRIWRILGGDGVELINGMLNNVHDKLAYLDVMEQNISEILNEYREKIKLERRVILDEIKKKISIDANLSLQKSVDKEREPKILARINRLPEDVVRYISEFLFTPQFRLHMLTSKYPDLATVMEKMKVPKLKKLSNVVCDQISSRFAKRFVKNKHIIADLPKNHLEYKMKRHVITYPHNVMRVTLRKSNKITEIVDFIKSCEWMTNFIERFGYKRTVSRMRNDIFHMYHTILYASRHEFNRNRSRQRTVPLEAPSP